MEIPLPAAGGFSVEVRELCFYIDAKRVNHTWQITTTQIDRALRMTSSS